jgi:hypothetical protein
VTRLVDSLSIVLLALACVAFLFGLRSLTQREDLQALYSLVVGALMLKAAVDLVRPKGLCEIRIGGD